MSGEDYDIYIGQMDINDVYGNALNQYNICGEYEFWASFYNGINDYSLITVPWTTNIVHQCMRDYMPGDSFYPPKFSYTVVHLNDPVTVTLDEWGPLIPFPYREEEDCKVGDLYHWSAEVLSANDRTGAYTIPTFDIDFETYSHDDADEHIVRFTVTATDVLDLGDWHVTITACLKYKPEECY